MSVYAKKVTKKQREWLSNYEHETGFEAIAQEDIDSGERTFEEVARLNIRWFEDHSSDALLKVSNYPQSEADELSGISLRQPNDA